MDGLFLTVLFAAVAFGIVFPVVCMVSLNRISRKLSEMECKINLLYINKLKTQSGETIANTELPEIDIPEEQTVFVPAEKPLEPEAALTPESTPKTASAPEIKTELKPEFAAEAAAPEAYKTPGRLEKFLDVQSEKLNDKIAGFEDRSAIVLHKIASWITVGEEYRTAGVAREYAVATTWLIRLGVIILLCGIGFFLKYSIDRNWTPPAVRVILMTVTGLAVTVAGSWKSRGKYRPLAIALAGAGIVTLYLSIMTAYKLYDLIPAPLAFAFMVAVTAAAMASALSANALLTALLGCIGGYLTPVFINTGSQNITALFIYMTILSSGTLLAARYKNWALLNISSFVMYLCIGAAAVNYLPQKHALAVIALLAVNYLIFTLQQISSSFKRDMSIVEAVMFCGNIAFFFAAALTLSSRYYSDWQLPALVSLFAAAAAFTAIIYLTCKIKHPPVALMIFLQIQLCFALTLTVPLLLGGVWVVAAWSVMAYLLMSSALKLKSRTLLCASVILYLVTAVREIAVPAAFTGEYSSYLDQLLAHLLTAGVYIASLTAAGIKLMRSVKTEKSPETIPVLGGLSQLFTEAAAGIFFLYSSYEIFSAVSCGIYDFRYGVLVLYWSVIFALLCRIFRKYMLFKLTVLPVILAALAGIWMLIWGEPYTIANIYWKSFLFTVLTAGIYISALLFTAKELVKTARTNSLPENQQNTLKLLAVIFYTLAGVLFWIYSSRELYEFLKEYLSSFRNGGLSVYWSALAFILLVWGLKKQYKALRMTSIALFVTVAFKIFFIDLANLEQLWRIVAFAAIGTVMLVGAVLYIRCKDMFIKNNEDSE